MATNFSQSNISLTGEKVMLKPFHASYGDELVALAELTNMSSLWFTQVPNKATIADYIETALLQQSANSALPFVVISKDSGKVIGTTRICNADFVHRRFEIGYTWYGEDFQKTAVNTECKLLLLTYIFEELDAIAVEFRTHWHNHKSRAAIARLGAKQDGVLRNHRIHPDGELRDTVVFSIIANEWPTVKKSLSYKLLTK